MYIGRFWISCIDPSVFLNLNTSVVSDVALAWYIRYIYFRKVPFLNKVIISRIIGFFSETDRYIFLQLPHLIHGTQ
jgi:hypothetical protein